MCCSRLLLPLGCVSPSLGLVELFPWFSTLPKQDTIEVTMGALGRYLITTEPEIKRVVSPRDESFFCHDCCYSSTLRLTVATGTIGSVIGLSLSLSLATTGRNCRA